MNVIPVSWKERDRLKAIRVWVVNVLRVATALWLIAHFILTIIYVCPVNPVKETLEPLLDATIERYFEQDWYLFAPNPVSVDAVLLVRPLSSSEYKLVQTKGLPSDGWYDLSAPLLEKYQSNRFSAYGKLSRSVVRTIFFYLDDPQEQQEQLMLKAASAFCKDIGQHNASYVALVIHEILSRPWPKRGTSEQRVVKTTLVGIYPVDKSVKNIHLYQIGGK